MKTKVLLLVATMACVYVSAQVPDGFISVSDFKEDFNSVSDPQSVGLGWGWQAGNPAKTYGTSSSSAIDGTYIYCTGNYLPESITSPTLLITPQLKGRMSFQIKPQGTGNYYVTNYLAKGKCWIRLYLGHSEEGVIVFDEAPFFERKFLSLPDEEERLNDAYWIACNTDVGDEYMYVGIQLSYIGLDNLCADACLLPENRDLRCVRFDIDNFTDEDSSPFFPNENGEATFRGSLTLTNQGNITLHPQEEKYSVSIVSQSSMQITIPETQIAINKTCAPGDSITIPVEVVMSMSDPSKDQRTALRALPNLTGAGMSIDDTKVYAQTPWFTIKSLVPTLYVQSTQTNQTINDYSIYLGLHEAPAKISFLLKSRGGSPVVIDSIRSIASDVTYEINGESVRFPLTIAMRHDTTLTVVYNTPGVYTDSLIFYFSDLQHRVHSLSSKDIHLSVYDPAQYMEQFDYYLTVPTGWCQPGWLNMEGSNWCFNSASHHTFAENGLRDANSRYLISPKLHFESSQSFTISAQPRTQASDVFLKILVSTNRRDWQVVGFIGSESEAAEQGVATDLVQNWALEGYDSRKESLASITDKYCTPYSINMPKGDWYIGFESGYALIDYVAGGTLAPLNHDFFAQFDGPTRAVQNEPYTADFIVRNMLDKTYTKRDYKVELREGGEVLCIPARTTIYPMSTDTFHLNFTPSHPGTYTINAKMLVGDEVVADFAKTIEVSLPIRHIVTSTSTGTTLSAPLNLDYRISQTEWIYTAEQLTDVDSISSLSIAYYNKEKAVNNITTIYLSDTEASAVDSTAGFTSTENMTKVYECSTTYHTDGSAAHPSLITYTFSEPFVRSTQHNLRLLFTTSEQENTARVYFACEDKTNGVLEYHANYKTNVSARLISSLPVMWIGLPSTKHETGNPRILQSTSPARKIFRDGKIYIQRGEQLYTIDGRKL